VWCMGKGGGELPPQGQVRLPAEGNSCTPLPPVSASKQQILPVSFSLTIQHLLSAFTPFSLSCYLILIDNESSMNIQLQKNGIRFLYTFIKLQFFG